MRPHLSGLLLNLALTVAEPFVGLALPLVADPLVPELRIVLDIAFRLLDVAE